MELSSTITKSQESDTDTETPLLQTHLSRALSLHHHHHPPPPPPPPVMVISYKECLKNHAATLGGLALDGCGEFLPTTTINDPTASLKCAACGCHRNFHRREPSGLPLPLPLPPVRHYWTTTSRSPSPSPSPSPSSTSPTPQQSVFPGAPAPAHMLMALSAAAGAQHCGGLENQNRNDQIRSNKRSRTKFTEEQKEKMYLFAEKLGWRMIRANDEDKRLDDFCSEIGVKRNVFKVWMHNNKQRIKDKVLINGSSN